METQDTLSTTESVLYAPYQYGPVVDTILWDLDFLSVVLISAALTAFLYGWARTVGVRCRNLFFVPVLIVPGLMLGGGWALYEDHKARNYWNERLFSLAKGYALAAENMDLHRIVAAPSSLDDPLYVKSLNMFRRWQEQDEMIVNVCAFRQDKDGNFVYVVRPAADYDGDGLSTGDLEESAVPGKIYGPGRDEPVLWKAFQTDTPQFTEFPYYAGGRPWLYAAVPIHSESGPIDMILVVDFHAGHWLESIRSARRVPLWGTLLAVFLILSAAIEIVLLFAALKKTTEVKDRLAESERKYRQVLDNCHDAISLLRNGKSILANRRMKILFGWNDDEEKNFVDVSPEFQPNHERTEDQYRKFIKQTEEGYSQFFDWTFVRTDGSLLPAEVFLDPVEIDGETLVIVVAHDLSIHHRAAIAEKESQTKSRFLAHMSHEIRTPLTAIIGYTEFILEEYTALFNRDETHRLTLEDCIEFADQHSQNIRTIRSNAEFLLLILNDILDLSKIEADKMVIESIEVPFQPFLHEIIPLYSVQAKTKGLDFSVRGETPLPALIHTDPLRLKQVLVNIIGNAIKFTQQGSIDIILSWKMDIPSEEWTNNHSNRHFTLLHPCEGTLNFTIKDSGIGMTTETLKELCSPFYQADASMARRFGGTGLGLAISKRLVNLLGGTLNITSEMDRGSTFSVALRQQFAGNSSWHTWTDNTVEESGQPSHTIPLRKDMLPGARILLVEDCVDNQRLFSVVLKKAGSEVVIAENGCEAVEMITTGREQENTFDLVLMDIQMPQMDGYEATTQIRAWEQDNGFERTPIIALTANAARKDEERCIEAGMDDFCGKPVNFTQLVSVICKWLMATSQQKNEPSGDRT